jgi:hypothetical protein
VPNTHRYDKESDERRNVSCHKKWRKGEEPIKPGNVPCWIPYHLRMLSCRKGKSKSETYHDEKWKDELKDQAHKRCRYRTEWNWLSRVGSNQQEKRRTREHRMEPCFWLCMKQVWGLSVAMSKAARWDSSGLVTRLVVWRFPVRKIDISYQGMFETVRYDVRAIAEKKSRRNDGQMSESESDCKMVRTNVPWRGKTYYAFSWRASTP